MKMGQDRPFLGSSNSATVLCFNLGKFFLLALPGVLDYQEFFNLIESLPHLLFVFFPGPAIRPALRCSTSPWLVQACQGQCKRAGLSAGPSLGVDIRIAR